MSDNITEDESDNGNICTQRALVCRYSLLTGSVESSALGNFIYTVHSTRKPHNLHIQWIPCTLEKTEGIFEFIKQEEEVERVYNIFACGA